MVATETAEEIGQLNAEMAHDNGDALDHPYASYAENVVDTAVEYGVDPAVAIRFFRARWDALVAIRNNDLLQTAETVARVANEYDIGDSLHDDTTGVIVKLGALRALRAELEAVIGHGLNDKPCGYTAYNENGEPEDHDSAVSIAQMA